MRSRLGIIATLAALSTGLMAIPAGAATSVTIATTAQNGEFFTVTGSSTFDDQPFVTIGTDATGDTLAPGFGAAGGDLTAAALATKTGGSVQFRSIVSEMPPAPLDGSPTGVVFAWDFCVNGDSCFEIDGGRNGLTSGIVGPYASLWSCASSVCDPADQTYVADLTAAMSAATNSFTVDVPLSMIDAYAGSSITGAGSFIDGPVITDVSDGGLFPLFEVGDGIATVDEFRVAARQVSMALIAPGADPATAAYPVTVIPLGNGSFSISTFTGTLAPGAYDVAVRACFGANNCAYTTQPVTIA